MNLFSITSHRGCGGGCTFCSITFHEGKRVVSRTTDSLLNEIEHCCRHPSWKGIISDIGGASAEMYGTDCVNLSCTRTSCLFKSICPSIHAPAPYASLLKQARRIKGVKKIFLGSGARFDLVMQNPAFLEEILTFHTGGYLRVAPEHTEEHILFLMRKPRFETFETFVHLFNKINRSLKRKVALAPYLIVGFPGETRADVQKMARRLKTLNVKTTDVQLFTPSPGTVATAMYYAGVSPTFQAIPIERDIRELIYRKQILAG